MVRGIGKDLQNSPLSGWREITVATDGNSRDRVKMCRHLKGILKDEEEWYRGNSLYAFSSLCSNKGMRAFFYFVTAPIKNSNYFLKEVFKNEHESRLHRKNQERLRA